MVRSIIDTLGLVAITSQYDLIIRGGGKGGMYVGTRIDKPVTLPRSSGRTEAIAFAAPVVVGMIFPKTVRPVQTISMENKVGLILKEEEGGLTKSRILLVVSIQHILRLSRSMHSR